MNPFKLVWTGIKFIISMLCVITIYIASALYVSWCYAVGAVIVLVPFSLLVMWLFGV